ncbi:unnamed protein product [Arabidopsis thaliana]|uniref:(thale cress) hypothetical protein n=1 Tax=Arabidopsis thaliana TaxID=3702 RepID=A0A7G2E1A0_ARATH|nr:unnamed protein product [Arabidopsis thaliana]
MSAGMILIFDKGSQDEGLFSCKEALKTFKTGFMKKEQKFQMSFNILMTDKKIAPTGYQNLRKRS